MRNEQSGKLYIRENNTLCPSQYLIEAFKTMTKAISIFIIKAKKETAQSAALYAS